MADSPLVAGKLPVPPGQVRRPPHQRIKPVEAQTYPPHKGPPGVFMPPVHLLMGQHMAETVGIFQAGGGEVDPGPQKPHQTGGGHRGGQEHRQRAIRLQRLCPYFRPVAESDIHRQEPDRHDGTAHEPYPGEPRSPLLLNRGDPAVGCAAGHRLRLGNLRGGGHSRNLRDRHQVLPRRSRLIDRFLLRPIQQTEGAVANGRRHQQPHRRQQPQGVLEPQADPPSHQPPQGGQHQDQHTGGQQHFLHGTSSSAFRKIAYSSSISSRVRDSRLAWVFTSIPTLPW